MSTWVWIITVGTYTDRSLTRFGHKLQQSPGWHQFTVHAGTEPVKAGSYKNTTSFSCFYGYNQLWDLLSYISMNTRIIGFRRIIRAVCDGFLRPGLVATVQKWCIPEELRSQPQHLTTSWKVSPIHNENGISGKTTTQICKYRVDGKLRPGKAESGYTAPTWQAAPLRTGVGVNGPFVKFGPNAPSYISSSPPALCHPAARPVAPKAPFPRHTHQKPGPHPSGHWKGACPQVRYVCPRQEK